MPRQNTSNASLRASARRAKADQHFAAARQAAARGNFSRSNTHTQRGMEIATTRSWFQRLFGF